MNYEKIFINESGDYNLIMIYPDGRRQKVSHNQDFYLEWLSEGNSPAEVPYIPPAPISLEDLRNKVISKIFQKRDADLRSGFNFNGKLIETSAESREFILGGARKAKKDNAYTAKAILADGTISTFSNQELKDIEEALDLWGDNIYNTCVTAYETALTATREQLEYYIANGGFES